MYARVCIYVCMTGNKDTCAKQKSTINNQFEYTDAQMSKFVCKGGDDVNLVIYSLGVSTSTA